MRQQQRILRWQSANAVMGNTMLGMQWKREFVLSGDWLEILVGGT